MLEKFESIDAKQLPDNPFTLIGTDWMLVTAGTMEHHNNLTASWGGVGVLWNKPVATIYIRPQRHTKQFIDGSDYFTLSVLPNELRSILTFCGRNSGRDVNKDEACDLHPFLTDVQNPQSVAYSEARLILVCRKLYSDSIKENGFIDSAVSDANYPQKDFHQMYIGEIVQVLQQK